MVSQFLCLPWGSDSWCQWRPEAGEGAVPTVWETSQEKEQQHGEILL